MRKRGTCSICDKPHHAHGLCTMHFYRQKRHGNPEVQRADKTGKTCAICNLPHYALGFCNTHWQRFKKFGTTDLPQKNVEFCSVCGLPQKGHGYCEKHLARYRKHRDPNMVLKARGEWSDHKGYKTRTENKKYISQHRKVVEAHIGRKLESVEIVHHINGDKSDNSIDNLAIMSRSEHMKIHRNVP